MLRACGMSDADALGRVPAGAPYLDAAYCKGVLDGAVRQMPESRRPGRPPGPAAGWTAPEMAGDTDALAFHADMDHKFVDRAIYHMLRDAAGSPIHFVGGAQDGRREPDLLDADPATMIRLLRD